MPSLEDSPLFLQTMADELTAADWEEEGSPVGARVLREKAFVRALTELGSVDEAEVLIDHAKSETRFDKKLIEDFEV